MDDFDYDDPYYNNYNKNNHVYNHPIVLQTQRRPEHYAILSSPSVTTINTMISLSTSTRTLWCLTGQVRNVPILCKLIYII